MNRKCSFDQKNICRPEPSIFYSRVFCPLIYIVNKISYGYRHFWSEKKNHIAVKEKSKNRENLWKFGKSMQGCKIETFRLFTTRVFQRQGWLFYRYEAAASVHHEKRVTAILPRWEVISGNLEMVCLNEGSWFHIARCPPLGWRGDWYTRPSGFGLLRRVGDSMVLFTRARCSVLMNWSDMTGVCVCVCVCGCVCVCVCGCVFSRQLSVSRFRYS